MIDFTKLEVENLYFCETRHFGMSSIGFPNSDLVQDDLILSHSKVLSFQ